MPLCRYWPFPDVPPCHIPEELTRACDRFKDFYLSKYNGRRLKWNTSLVR